MKVQFLNHVYNSFFLWVDHIMTDSGELDAKYTADNEFKLLRTSDTGNVIFQGQYRQLCSEDSGNLVLNVNGSDINAFDNGYFINYYDGSVITNISNSGDTILQESVIKEVNVYPPKESTEQDFFGEDFSNYTDSFDEEHFISQYKDKLKVIYSLPAVFCIQHNIDHSLFELGGGKEAKFDLTMLCLVKSNYQLQGIFSKFTEKEAKNIPLINVEDGPYKNDWTLKGGNYQYDKLDSSNMFHIDYIRTSAINYNIFAKDSQYKVGLIDFQCSLYRGNL